MLTKVASDITQVSDCVSQQKWIVGFSA
jgi:hypothetical protein